MCAEMWYHIWVDYKQNTVFSPSASCKTVICLIITVSFGLTSGIEMFFA